MQTEYCSCPGCSGNLVFRIREGRLFCDHCGQSYDVPEYDRSVRRAANPAPENPDAPEDSYTECPSCGGEISPGALGATETCPFCGNALILSGKIRRQAEPDFIIPFTLDRGDFMENFRKILAAPGSVPDEIIREIRPENMQARYIPFWLYDVRAEGRAAFKNPRREDRRWTFLAESAAELEFRDVTQDATTELDDGLSQNLEPYDPDSARPFSYSWLSGLDARIYNMDDRQSYQTVRDRVIASLNRKLIPYDSCDLISRDINILPRSVSYALFPVWTLELAAGDQTYIAAMNGATGKIAAALPQCRGKSALICISAALICETLFLPLFFWHPPLTTVMRAEHDPGSSWQVSGLPFSGFAVLAGLLLSVIAAEYLRNRTALKSKKDLALMTAFISAAAISLMLLAGYLNFLINDTVSVIFLTVLILSLSAELAIQFGNGSYRAAKLRKDNFPDLKSDADEFLLKDFSSWRLTGFRETEPYEEIFSQHYP
ncbi:hypothetical protein [Succinimonas sp.]|uniref:hypothetical protein n=1 Tax=Succinimonas sp. TaxID=1936151 RepID=UPI00386F942B